MVDTKIVTKITTASAPKVVRCPTIPTPAGTNNKDRCANSPIAVARMLRANFGDAIIIITSKTMPITGPGTTKPKLRETISPTSWRIRINAK